MATATRAGFSTFASGMLAFFLYWLPVSALLALDGVLAVIVLGDVDPLSHWPHDPLAFYGAFLRALVPALVDAAIVVAAFGGVAAMTRDLLDGKPARAATGFATFLHRGRELVECGIVVALVLFVGVAGPLLPALGAVYLNATMGTVFLYAGLAAGLAIVFLTFRRFMFAPGLVATRGLSAPLALRESGRIARATRNGLFAIELSIVLAIVAFIAAVPATVASVAEGRASMAGLAASVVAGALLWPLIPVAVSRWMLDHERGGLAPAEPVVGRPTLSGEERETSCPRCGTRTRFVARAGGGEARCAACGLSGRVV
ncbi:MAG TPA: TFIIB-type zinc ribbon-containing protein [Candidatus Thermoplasmatota archaeon]|nr:TFIIB-type zinc ribbon-containing protein [Candidatus Thermoplasmatota archaeon]